MAFESNIGFFHEEKNKMSEQKKKVNEQYTIQVGGNVPGEYHSQNYQGAQFSLVREKTGRWLFTLRDAGSSSYHPSDVTEAIRNAANIERECNECA